MAKPTDHKLVYDVYAGGIHAVEATFYLDVHQSTAYGAFLEAQTRGFLGKLAPWQGTFESYGWHVGNSDYRPKLHKSTATWREETEVKEYTYDKDRTFQSLVVQEHGKLPRQEDKDESLTDGTTDVLSAALSVFENVADNDVCEGSHDVFDGKRRFQLVFDHEKILDIKPSKYNVYAGTATQCTVEVVPVSGEWHEKPRGWLSIQEQGRERGTMPTIWVAPLIEGGPALPVKIRIKTAYGTLFMHLADYEYAGYHVTAKKRK